MKKAERQMRSIVVNGLVMSVALGLAMAGAGCKCTKKEPQPDLLGARPVVPSAFAAPSAALPPPVVPVAVEPAIPDTLELEPTEPVLPAPPPAPEVKSKILTYKVKSGDSLWKIAWQHHVSVDELAEFNGLKAGAVLPVGKTLNIPPGGRFDASRPLPKAPAPKKPAAAAAAAAPAPKVPAPGSEPLPADGRYTVKKNDNLWLIARRFDLHVADIRAANNLTTDRLEIGQVLILSRPGGAAVAAPIPAAPVPPAVPDVVAPPAPLVPPAPVAPGGAAVPPPAADVVVPPAAPAAALPPNTLEHIVVANDTLDSIADIYGTKVEELLKVNPQIKGNADLKPAMTILVPYR